MSLCSSVLCVTVQHSLPGPQSKHARDLPPMTNSFSPWGDGHPSTPPGPPTSRRAAPCQRGWSGSLPRVLRVTAPQGTPHLLPLQAADSPPPALRKKLYLGRAGSGDPPHPNQFRPGAWGRGWRFNSARLAREEELPPPPARLRCNRSREGRGAATITCGTCRAAHIGSPPRRQSFVSVRASEDFYPASPRLAASPSRDAAQRGCAPAAALHCVFRGEL